MMDMQEFKDRIAKSIYESLEYLGEEANTSEWFAPNKFAEETE